MSRPIAEWRNRVHALIGASGMLDLTPDGGRLADALRGAISDISGLMRHKDLLCQTGYSGPLC
jgi:hypothetical protein